MSADSVIVEEVRGRAMAISAEYEHDLKRYTHRLRQIQAENASRVVSQLTVVKAENASRAVSQLTVVKPAAPDTRT